MIAAGGGGGTGSEGCCGAPEDVTGVDGAVGSAKKMFVWAPRINLN